MKSDTKKRECLDKLLEAKGIISYACQNVGISRRTYYNWIKDDEAFRNEAEEITEHVIDLVEAKLLSRINDDDVTSIIFYLKTKGKKRGYIERVETHDLTERDPIRVTFVMPESENE